MLVNYDDGDNFLFKLIATIPGEYNDFDGYQLIVQDGMRKINSGSVLFQDYKFSPNLTNIYADSVNDPCFVIESDSKNKVACLERGRKIWTRTFTKVYADDSYL